MANDSVKQETRIRQSLSKDCETSDVPSPVLAMFDGISPSKTFSLTFTSSQWCLFWRLLTVGCMLADELLDLLTDPTPPIKPETALLWNRLSAQLAMHLNPDAVLGQEEMGVYTMR